MGNEFGDLKGGYNIIYADPPWDYENDQCGAPTRGGITYPTMPIDDICSLPVGDIAHDNCALFLWATWPKLKQALQVIDAWGFDYRTCAFDWVKTYQNGTSYCGLGHWTRLGTEPCLFARRGKIKRYNKNVYQQVFAPIGKHSQKPPEVRDKIINLCGDLPRVELFARQRVDGWDCWGNELDGTILPRHVSGQMSFI